MSEIRSAEWQVIDALLSANEYIKAIKFYRSRSNEGLRESKKAVDKRREDRKLTANSIDVGDEVRMNCLSFRFFEDTDDVIRGCFAQAAERCIERRREIINDIATRTNDVATD